VLTRFLKRPSADAPQPQFESDEEFIRWARAELEKPVLQLERYSAMPPDEKSEWISDAAQAYHAGTLMHISERSWLEVKDRSGTTVGYLNKQSVAQAVAILEMLPFLDEEVLEELQPRGLPVSAR
jgi:hypothetical protein